MRDEHAGRPILVGYYDVPESRHALTCALEEARLRSLPALAGRLLHWRYTLTPLSDEAMVQIDQVTQTVVEEGTGCARELAVDVRRLRSLGTCSVVLLEFGNEAKLTVLGSRGHGGFDGLQVGSTAVQRPACDRPVECLDPQRWADPAAGSWSDWTAAHPPTPQHSISPWRRSRCVSGQGRSCAAGPTADRRPGRRPFRSQIAAHCAKGRDLLPRSGHAPGAKASRHAGDHRVVADRTAAAGPTRRRTGRHSPSARQPGQRIPALSAAGVSHLGGAAQCLFSGRGVPCGSFEATNPAKLIPGRRGKGANEHCGGGSRW